MTPTPRETPDRCALRAAERGDPLVGTAFPAARVLLVEQPGSWGSGGIVDSDFDPGADSAAFDDLVGKADVELDADARNEFYRQAEELAIKNAVYIPLGHWVQMYVQKPWLQGTKQGPWTGRLPVWFDKDVVVLQHE